MRENKEKTITSGDEDATTPLTAPPVVQATSVQTGKRKSKSISSAVDLDDLPSRQGPKKQKPGKASLRKVSKVTPPTVNLDYPPVDVEPVQIIHPIHTDPPPPSPVKTSRKPNSSEPSDHPSNLVLDESYAWRTFKGIVIEHEVNECYNMSVKEFERSGIHDLFKVSISLVLVCFYSKILNEMSNFLSSIHRLCQNFTQRLARLRSSLQRLRLPRIRLRR